MRYALIAFRQPTSDVGYGRSTVFKSETSVRRRPDMLLRLLPAALVVCVAAAACGGAPEKAPATTSSGGSTPAAAAAGGAAEFGVPECDDYIKKYLACIDSKMPEAGRAMARQSLDQTKASWQQAASTPQGKSGLAMGCKAATDAAKTSLAAYGCSF
jgi:hypothetical protein